MKKLLLIVLMFAAFSSCQKTATNPIAPLVMADNDELLGNGTERKPLVPPGKNKPKPPQDTTVTNPPDTTTPTDPPTQPPTNENAVVVLLDFDGNDYQGGYWAKGYTTPADASVDSNEVLSIIRLEYTGYNVRFTTGEAEFQAANTFRRIRVMIAGNDLYGVQGGSGVAYVESAFWGAEAGQTEAPPAFVYASNLQNYEYYIGEIASHEIGHTLGLRHMGFWDAACLNIQTYACGYVMGNGTCGTGSFWAPGHPCRYQGGAYGKSDHEVLSQYVGTL